MQIFKPKIIVLLSFLIVMAMLVPASAAGLEATAPGIAVLPLPAPAISSVDAATGIVHLSISDVDPDISADLRVIVSLFDAAGNLTETAEVKVTDHTTVKVPLKTSLQNGHVVSAKVANNDTHSSEADGVSEFTKPQQNSGASGQSVSYLVSSTESGQLLVEKIVEVEKPVYICGGSSGQTGLGQSQTEEPASTAPEDIPQDEPPQKPAENVPDESPQAISDEIGWLLVFIVGLIPSVVTGLVLLGWKWKSKKAFKKR